jgi:ABC-type transport system involved in multi-copper enzyme maturation permease subunit
MGIYEPTYRRFEGKLQGRMVRISTIFKHEFKRRMKNKWVLVLLLLAWVLGVLPTVFTGNFFVYFITAFIWLLLFTSIVGGPIIAEDFKYNSITLFLSRPVQRSDYFIGKYLTLFTLISLISFLPTILVTAIVIGTNYGNPLGDFDYYRFSYSILGIGFLMTFVFTNIGLAFSSLTKNHKYASGGIFAAIFFSNIISLALTNLYEDIIYFSIWSNFLIIFMHWNDGGGEDLTSFDGNISLAVLLVVSIMCLIIVWLRIQRAELSE